MLIDKMNALTSTEDCLANPEDGSVYLAWKDMKFTMFGENIIESNEQIENLCKNKDPMFRIILPGTHFSKILKR